MEIVLGPKKAKKPRKKKIKEERVEMYTEDGYQSSFDQGLLQKAVDTILCKSIQSLVLSFYNGHMQGDVKFKLHQVSCC